MAASELGRRRHGAAELCEGSLKSESEDGELRSVELLERDSWVTTKQAALAPTGCPMSECVSLFVSCHSPDIFPLLLEYQCYCCLLWAHKLRCVPELSQWQVCSQMFWG